MQAVADKVRWYYDGGHEWLAVPVALVKAAGIWDQVSACSYIDRALAIVYLEGDCDAALYCDAARLDNDAINAMEQVDLGEYAFIRNLYRFRR